MATKIATKRLQKEFQAMQKSPPPFVVARFEEKNILDWHFIIRGPPDSPYTGGEYHGLIMFPSEYPFKPPDIKLFTPSGRFETNTKICMSMTSYHPSTWNAAWSVATILTGLLSFMLTDEITTGAVKSTDEDKKRFAAASHGFNIANRKFRDIFPEYAGPEMKDLPDMGQASAPTTGKTQSGSAEEENADSSRFMLAGGPLRVGQVDASFAGAGSDGAAMELSNEERSRADASSCATIPGTRSTADKLHIPGQKSSSTAIATIATGANGIQKRAQDRQSWFSRWRWVLAALAVIILGRISSF